jgi:serine/threonine protein kinase
MIIDELDSPQFNKYRIDPSQYDKVEKLGAGNFGTVYHSEDNATKAKVALKKLSSPGRKQREQFMKDLTREVNMLAKIQGPCFLKFIGFSTQPKYSIITEYAPN